MKHLQNVLDGMAGVLESWSTRRDYQPSNNGFSNDRQALASDARKVAADIRRTTQETYGKSRTSSTR